MKPAVSVVHRTECPACGCSKFVKSQASTGTDEEILATLVDTFSGTETWRRHLAYHRCAQCDLLFNVVYPSPQTLEELYQSVHFNDVGQPGPALDATHRWLAVKFLGPRAKNLRGPLTVLELGPDVGRFASHLNSVLDVKAFDFVEPNLTAWEQLRQSVPNTRQLTHGIKEIKNLCQYDLVVAHHVFDHDVSIRETFRTIEELTGIGSLMSIVVHDHSSWLARAMGDKWPPYCLQHPQLFTTKALEEFLESNNWKPVYKDHQKNAIGVLSTAGNLANIFFKRSLIKPTKDLVIPMWFGNLAFVAERCQ